MRTFTSRITKERTSYIEGWTRGSLFTGVNVRIRAWAIERLGRSTGARASGARPREPGGVETAIKTLSELPEKERTMALMKVSLANPRDMRL